MENASKALIMAGGVLLAILIIAMLIYMWSNTSSFISSQDDEKELQQIVSFNKQFESYQKSVLRGADVASVINKVRNNNSAYADNNDYKISCKFILTDSLNGSKTLSAGEYDVSTYSSSNPYDAFIKDDKDDDDFKNFKRLYFRCEKIEYSTKTRRVNNIVFKEISQNEINKKFDTEN